MPNLLKNLKIFEVSLVANPANPGAQVVVFKSDDVESDTLKATFDEVLEAAELEQKLQDVMRPMWEVSELLRTSFKTILEDKGIKDKREALKQSVRQFADYITGKLDDIKTTSKEDSNMPNNEVKKEKEEVKSFDQAAVDALVKEAVEKALADSVMKIQRLEIVAKMSDKEKVYFEKLDEAGKAEFLKMAPDARMKIVQKSELDDEVLNVDGRVIRKSEVGSSLFEILKVQNTLIQSAKAQAELELEKRLEQEAIQLVEKEYGNLPGEVLLKAKILRHINCIQDETLRKGFMELLKSANAAFQKFFVPAGASAGGSQSGSSAQAKLEKMAKDYAQEHKVSISEAWKAIANSEEGNELYKEHLAESNQ